MAALNCTQWCSARKVDAILSSTWRAITTQQIMLVARSVPFGDMVSRLEKPRRKVIASLECGEAVTDRIVDEGYTQVDIK